MPELSQAESAPAVERRIVSVLFADLVGFTTLSEALDAEDVASIQDAYFAAVRETVERYGGTLEKFIGDAAMAVFGAPHARDDDAERAVRAGLALIGALEQLGARLELEPRQLRLRVGVNSGEVVHATSGPDAGRVTGDTVNTAARIQAAAEPDSVLVGELTALAIRETVELTDKGQLSLKGKAEPVHAWRADAVRDEPSRDAALGDLRAPLLGRGDELRLLDALTAGRLTIIAPPGVGKSRLVAEAAVRAESRGMPVLRARSRPQAATPYEAVAHLLTAAGAADRLREALAPFAAARRELIERDVAAALAPRLRRRRRGP
jgi:class 3 adenylate cyclase